VTVTILLGSRRYPRLPVSLLAVAAVSLANLWGNWGAPVIGDIPRGLPRPSAGFFSWGLLQDVAPAAVAVAALAALESLLCATVADAMSVKENHDPDRELFGQGVANLAVPFFGGVPATAAIARTAVCVRAGATSRLAAVVHSVAILAVVLVASPLVAHVPLAALAGVLFATTLRMVERASIVALLRATRGDRWTLILTFLVTISVDLVTAVVVGMVVAGVLALQAVARAARLDRVPLEQGEYSADEHQLLTDHIVAYRLDGPLFFAAAHQFLLELTSISDVRVVILRLSRVSTMDATGARVLGDAVSRLERRGIIVLLSGIAADHDEMLASLGVAEHLRREGKIFPHTPAAIAAAREMIADHLDHARRAHANSMADGS
jgi:SulP family sulfate permease